MKPIINQSFFVTYEFDEQRNILDHYLFFRFPKNIEGFIINNNFIPNNYLINPLVNEAEFNRESYLSFYTNENWYKSIDYDFRKAVNTKVDSSVKISLAHLNIENDGYINKTFITYSQQYIKYDDRKYIINIIFFINQGNLNEGDSDYTSFIIKNNLSNIVNEKIENEKYSDKWIIDFSI